MIYPLEMLPFGLLVGHMLGDYVFQNDWQAYHKTPQPPAEPRPPHEEGLCGQSINSIAQQQQWDKALYDSTWAVTACTVHCLLYTLCVFITCWPWLAWRTNPVIFAAHWPVDRWRLARYQMSFMGQEKFATMPTIEDGKFKFGMGPWSVILVD